MNVDSDISTLVFGDLPDEFRDEETVAGLSAIAQEHGVSRFRVVDVQPRPAQAPNGPNGEFANN